jgi:DNA-binding transcriptional ArsR family regulator
MSPRRRYRQVGRAEAISLLSDSDREIVQALVEHRVATTQQLAALLGMPERTARHRLGRLYELGLAARPEKRGYSQEGSAPHVWWPTRVADAYATGAPTPRGGERDVPGTVFVEHAVAVTGLHVAFVTLARSLGLELVSWTREAKEGFVYGERHTAIVPDATVVVTAGEAEYRAFIEMDLGTMSTTRLTQKLGGYAAYARTEAWRQLHPYCPVLLFVTIAEPRAERVVRVFEDKWRWEERRSGRLQTAHRLEGFSIAACSAARNPEMALREPVWITRDGIDGLGLKELLHSAWETFCDGRQQELAAEEEQRAARARLRSEPEARRAQIQSSVHARHSHKLQLGDLEGDKKAIMEQLIDSKEPMTAGERVAFRFFEARVAHQESGTAPIEHKPLTRAEQRAIDALVDERFETQRLQVAALYARHQHVPSLLRAVQELSAGNLLPSSLTHRLPEVVRDDLKLLKSHKGRALDYRQWRDGMIRARKAQRPALARLLTDSARLATEMDMLNLWLCTRCEQLAIPSRDDIRYEKQAQCSFCGDTKLEGFRDAATRGLVEPDGNGWWRVCHRPVPPWVTARAQWAEPGVER